MNIVIQITFITPPYKVTSHTSKNAKGIDIESMGKNIFQSQTLVYPIAPHILLIKKVFEENVLTSTCKVLINHYMQCLSCVWVLPSR